MKHERKWDRRRSEKKVHVLSSLVLFHGQQAGGEYMYHSLHPSGGGLRTHMGAITTDLQGNRGSPGSYVNILSSYHT